MRWLAWLKDHISTLSNASQVFGFPLGYLGTLVLTVLPVWPRFAGWLPATWTQTRAHAVRFVIVPLLGGIVTVAAISSFAPKKSPHWPESRPLHPIPPISWKSPASITTEATRSEENGAIMQG